MVPFCFKIVHYHNGNLERHGIFECTQIQSCPFLDLFQAVNERISVHMELPRGLRDIQVILKKFIYRGGSIFVQPFLPIIP